MFVGTRTRRNYCFPMFMTLFRFHNSTEHRGFECTFLIYQALYQAIRPFSWQTPRFHKSLLRNEKNVLFQTILILRYVAYTERWSVYIYGISHISDCCSLHFVSVGSAWFTGRQIFFLSAFVSNLIPDKTAVYHGKYLVGLKCLENWNFHRN